MLKESIIKRILEKRKTNISGNPVDCSGLRVPDRSSYNKGIMDAVLILQKLDEKDFLNAIKLSKKALKMKDQLTKAQVRWEILGKDTTEDFIKMVQEKEIDINRYK